MDQPKARKIFVTGATGFIGQKLCLYLADKGHVVHAFYRNANKTAGLQHKNIILFKGDLLDQESLDRAMEGSVHADTDVEELERRYHRVGKLLAWLDKEEARTRKVIDVRNWFDFRAEERRCSEHPEGGEIVQSYRGAGG